MIYYIIDKKIIGYESELDTNLYSYAQLTEAQTTFYELNPRATLNEVLNMQLNEPTAEEIFFTAKENKKSEWSSKLENGYLSTATNSEMSLTTSVVDGSDILNNAVLLAIDVPAKINAGMPQSTEYTIRDKSGAKIQGANLGMTYLYLMEITKIGAKIKEINGLLFDATSEEDLNNIDLNFTWESIIA